MLQRSACLTACACLVLMSACASRPAPYEPGPYEPARRTDQEKVETLHFEIEIAAPVERVWEVMFSEAGYTQWTEPFMPGSTFVGDWSEGSKMWFVSQGQSGMVAEIDAHRPLEVLSIKHIGIVNLGAEDTTSESVRGWAPTFEIYRFRSVPGGTVVSVEQDSFQIYVGMMNNTWPKALAVLKELSEAA